MTWVPKWVRDGENRLWEVFGLDIETNSLWAESEGVTERFPRLAPRSKFGELEAGPPIKCEV